MSTQVTNFAKTTVSIGYDAVATSIVLVTGHGSRLPSVFPYPVVWWNVTDYADPADDPNREIVTVTNRSGDTLTVTRGAESTGASTKNTAGKSYRIIESITKGMWDELANLSLSQDFRGLDVRTHTDSDLAASSVRLVHADSIVMDDGQEVTDWNDVDADLSVSGLGGLDTGTEQASTWYQILALHNGSLKQLQLHRAKNYLLDQSNTAVDDGQYILRRATGNANVLLAQGFQTTAAGLVEFVDVKLIRAGAVTGNIWFTLESNAGGVPSGTVLTTSDKYDAARFLTTAQWVRMPFRTPAALSAATQYHLVLQGDYTASDTVYIAWRADLTGATYANGNAAWATAVPVWTQDAGNDFLFKVYVTENDVTYTPPAGYTKAMIGWAYNDSGSNLKQFRALNRSVSCGADADWLVGTFGAATALVDLFAFVPPIPVRVAFNTTTITNAGAQVYGDIVATDATAGTAPGRGTVTTNTALAGWTTTPPLVLSAYQGMVIDVSAASAKPYVACFEW